MSKSSQDKVVAYLLLISEGHHTEDTLKMIRNMPEVEEAYIIYGEWDLILKVQIPSLAELTKLVMKLRKTIGVKKTSTLITLDS